MAEKYIYELTRTATDEDLTSGSYIAIDNETFGSKKLSSTLLTPASRTSSIESSIAPDYAGLTFPIAKGTQCFHGGGYFYANTDIATSEEWTPAHWTETSVAEQIGNVEALLAAL